MRPPSRAQAFSVVSLSSRRTIKPCSDTLYLLAEPCVMGGVFHSASLFMCEKELWIVDARS